MKLWLKYVLAATLGILAGLIVKSDTFIFFYILGAAEFGLRLGRFILFPLFFFTLTVSVCQLRRDSLLAKTFFKILLFSLAAGILQILISTGLALLLPIDRIPIISETPGWQSPFPFRNASGTGSLQDILRNLLPVNAFKIFNNTGDFILPALIFSFFLGTQLYHDREEAEPLFNFFDSSSRVLYRMNSLFTKVFTILLIPVGCITVVHIREIGNFTPYMGLLRIVLAASVIILFGLYPLAYFLITRRRPYSDMRVFYSALIASMLTGDGFINSQILLRNLKENGGMKREASGLSIPLLTMFSRTGTAMITSICLLTILKSYSSLELTAFQVFWVIGVSLLISLLLFAQSYTGVYTALIISCGLYGRGLVEGYVLILPVLPILVLFAGVLDTANTAFITLAAGMRKNSVSPWIRKILFKIIEREPGFPPCQ